MARALLASVGVLVALALPACGGGDDAAFPVGGSGTAPPAAAAPTAVSTAGPTASQRASDEVLLPDLEQLAPAPSGVVDEDTEETIRPQVVPTWDEESRAAVVTAAAAVMTAFARPDLDAGAWTAGLQPLLTPQAAEDYAYVDPSAVPASTVTGPGVLMDDASAYVAGVDVPTDVGLYRVVLSRTDAAAPWLTERVTPPAEVG